MQRPWLARLQRFVAEAPSDCSMQIESLHSWREAERKQRPRQEFGVGAVASLLVAGVIAFRRRVGRWKPCAIDSLLDRNNA